MTLFRHPKRMICVCVLILLLLSAAALALRPDWRYLCLDPLVRLGRSASVEILDQAALELTEYRLDQLLAMEGVTEDRSLMLINDSCHIPEGYEPRLEDYQGTGVEMDRAMTDSFAALSQRVRSDFGQTLYVRSSYRTREEQAQTIREDGEVAASLDASEHQAGLALDVYVPGYAGRAFLKTEAGRFVNDRCWEYGFIIRYPYYGRASTGIGYEPWHLRYVGQPHARIIMENSWTLEEYYDFLEPGVFCRFGDTLITRQTGETVLLPSDWTVITVSPDNQGGMVFTISIASE